MAGARLKYHYNRFSQRGGLMHYPLSGVVSGTEVESVSITGTQISFDVTSGEILLDSTRFNHGGVTGVTLDAGVNLTSTELTTSIYLLPTRNNPVGEARPAASSSDVGQIHIKVNDLGDYYVVDEFQVVKEDESGTKSWEKLDDIKDIPYTRGNQNEYPLNTVDTVITNSNFSLENEKPVYHKTAQKPYVTNNANAELRNPGGIKVATIYFDGGGNFEVIEGIGRNYHVDI